MFGVCRESKEGGVVRKKIKHWKDRVVQAAKAGKELLGKFVSGTVGKFSAGVLVVVFIALGTTFGWQCGKDGCNCSIGYKPPDPDNVRKIIKVEGVTHTQLKHKTVGVGIEK